MSAPEIFLIREEEDRLEAGKDEETSQFQGHSTVVDFTSEAMNTAPVNTSLPPKAGHTEEINSANQELRAIWLGDTCWQDPCIGCPRRLA